MKDEIDMEYKKYREKLEKRKERDRKKVAYGVIKVEIWGGSRKNPEITGYDEVAGIIIGNWLYYKEEHKIDGAIRKYKTNANKVVRIKRYNSYEQLIEKKKKYKNTKVVFNRLIKEKGLN